MTTIKCKKCEHDIEIPSESRNCLECGKPVIGSINAAIKESKMETKAILDNKAQAKKTIRALQKKTAKEINENGKIVNRKLVMIKDKATEQIKAMPADATNDMMKAVAEQANKDQDEIFNAGTKQAEAIMKKHTDEVAKIAKDAGIDAPKSSLDIARLSKDDVVAAKQVKSEKAMDFIQYGVFFLITPLGMLTIEEFFAVGLLLLVAGVIALPPISKKILSSFNWLSSVNLFFITHVLVVAGLYRLTMLVS